MENTIMKEFWKSANTC